MILTTKRKTIAACLQDAFPPVFPIDPSLRELVGPNKGEEAAKMVARILPSNTAENFVRVCGVYRH